MPRHPSREPIPFGAWLLEAMERKGTNAAELARDAGVHSGTISKMIYDFPPTPRTAVKLADALKVPLATVLEAAGHPAFPEPTRSPTRERIDAILDGVDETILAVLEPMLSGIARRAQQDRVLARIREGAGGPGAGKE